MLEFDRWRETGFAEVADRYVSRLDRSEGVHNDIGEGGDLLHDGAFAEGALTVSGGKIAALSSSAARSMPRLDAHGLKVLPGIVDIHGDDRARTRE